MSRTLKVLLAVFVIAVLAVAAYAFAAANVVPNTRAGDGSGTVSGYTVSNVAYTLNATDPSTLDSVSFDLDAAAVNVKAQLVNAGTWYNCTNTAGNSWSCTTTGLTVVSIDQLRVVATSN